MLKTLIRSSFFVLFHLFLFITPFSSHTQDTLRVMNYNLLNYPGSTPERHEYLRRIVHYSEPDVVLSNELISRSGSETLLDSSFNRFGTSKYDTARFIDGPDTDNMLFYNSDKIGLADQDTIQTQLRKIDHYKVFYKDTGLGNTHTDTSFLHLFALHLKASTGWSDQQEREQEVKELMAYLDDLGDSAEVIVAGDFNIYWPTSEPAWSELTDASYKNTLYDPLETSGDWHDNPQHADIHTQSTRDNGCTGTAVGATGGMDDRFDLNLVDEDVLNGNGRYKILTSTYKALGQQGDHMDTCIVAPPNITIVPDSIRQAVYHMSDHMPVVMDVEWDCREGFVESTDTSSICQGDTAWVAGNPYLTEGWAYDTSYSELSCNRFDATWVEVQPVDTMLFQSGDSLIAQAQNASFQWYDCDGDSALSGETDSIFAPSSEGTYSVEVSQDTCTDRSSCVDFNYTSIPPVNEEASSLRFHHARREARVFVRSSEGMEGHLRIYDLQGRPLKEKEANGQQELGFRTDELSPGVYLLEFRSDEGQREVWKWTDPR